MSRDDRPRLPALAVLSLGLLVAVLVWTRLLPIRSGLWNDEACSAVRFIEGGPRAILFPPYLPNNHVLFSLLTWPTIRVLGESEWVYRLWSVVPAVAAVAIVALWLLRRLDAWCALAFAVALVSAPVHLDLAPQARGYGLGFFAAALTLIGACDASEGARPRRAAALFTAGGLIGVLTLPVFVLPFLGQAAALVALRRSRRDALLCTAAVGMASLIVYAALLRAIAEASGQDFGGLVGFGAVVVGPYADLMRPAFDGLVPNAPLWLGPALFAALFGLGVAGLWRRGRVRLVAAACAPIAVTYLGLAALHLHSVSRFVSYLLIDVGFVLAVGAVELVHLTHGRARALAVGVLVVLAVLALARVGSLAIDAAETPFEAYRPAVGVAIGAGIPKMVTNSQFDCGFEFYARPQRIAFATPDQLERLFCESTEPFVFVHSPLFMNPVDVSCLLSRGAAATVVPQRYGGRAGWMTVYVLRPGSG